MAKDSSKKKPAEEQKKQRSILLTYLQTFAVCLAMVALAIFVLWDKFTSPVAEGGMGVSASAVWILAGILVAISAIACRRGYLNTLERENQ